MWNSGSSAQQLSSVGLLVVTQGGSSLRLSGKS